MEHESKSEFLAIRATPMLYGLIRERAARDKTTMTAVMEAACEAYLSKPTEQGLAVAA
jgi:hypothetical protein